MATTGMCDSAKVEFLAGAHSFEASQSAVSCSGTSTQFTLTSLASTAALVVGMAVSGTNVASGAVIASIDSSTQVTLSKAHTGTVTAASFGGDPFSILLINGSPAHTFDHTQTNVGTPGSGTPGTANVGTDEVSASGTGYTSGGFALTNIAPALSSTTATTSFSVNPSWTSATFTASAALIYNTAKRLGGIAGRSISVHDFGGNQSVTAGTFTLLMPTNNSSSAILRIA
ncbi:hypothetical protein CWB41_14055 [Methylovirgula ligni]|uniref:Uncharacterized protein n=1 Tax=Methylovirgula ligni TaxID=569860 RepID=A0A3D9YP24_9HYPH|nr:hypothetical protein [Methylovirgula ligni]QAY96717.1 hypothetical protein CWB41_14055 [Methylovirgula ligni]REF83243.1 hypothetical protein DES32_3159 [Methylovirgula ligni]